MSHLNPFHPAMACERQPLSKLPPETLTIIKAFAGPPSPTPTAALMTLLIPQWIRTSNMAGEELDFMIRGLGSDDGFLKYLRHHFHRSSGTAAVCYRHKRYGHLFVLTRRAGDNSLLISRMFDAAGNPCNYPGFNLPTQ